MEEQSALEKKDLQLPDGHVAILVGPRHRGLCLDQLSEGHHFAIVTRLLLARRGVSSLPFPAAS